MKQTSNELSNIQNAEKLSLQKISDWYLHSATNWEYFVINSLIKKTSNINEYRFIVYTPNLIFDDAFVVTIKFHEWSSTAKIKPFFF